MNIVKGPLADEPATEAGWTLVISGHPGTFRLGSDKRLTFFERLFGKYRFYQVFTAPHRVEFNFVLQTNQSTFKFAARVSGTAKLLDPVTAIEEGVSSTADQLRQSIEQALQKAVRPIDYQNAEEAWRNGLAALEKLKHPLIAFSDIVLTIDPDADARGELRTIEGQKLRNQATEVISQEEERERAKILANFGSLDQMLALLLTTDNAEKRASLKEAIAMRIQRDAQVTQWQIETFKYLVDSGRYEEHEIPSGLSNLLEQMNKTYATSASVNPLLRDDSESAAAEGTAVAEGSDNEDDSDERD